MYKLLFFFLVIFNVSFSFVLDMTNEEKEIINEIEQNIDKEFYRKALDLSRHFEKIYDDFTTCQLLYQKSIIYLGLKDPFLAKDSLESILKIYDSSEDKNELKSIFKQSVQFYIALCSINSEKPDILYGLDRLNSFSNNIFLLSNGIHTIFDTSLNEMDLNQFLKVAPGFMFVRRNRKIHHDIYQFSDGRVQTMPIFMNSYILFENFVWLIAARAEIFLSFYPKANWLKDDIHYGLNNNFKKSFEYKLIKKAALGGI
jgi:hypothetical protein